METTQHLVCTYKQKRSTLGASLAMRSFPEVFHYQNLDFFELPSKEIKLEEDIYSFVK